jgi:hypothetical protein
MFRPMNVHYQEVSCGIQTLWYNVMSRYVWYYGESSLYCIQIEVDTQRWKQLSSFR